MTPGYQMPPPDEWRVRVQPGPEWPFAVERRLGHLEAHSERDRESMGQLREEVRRVSSQVEMVGDRLAGQMQSEFGRLRAEQAAAPAQRSEIPVRWLLLGGALAAAVLVGIGVEVGAGWRPSDTREMIQGLAQ